LRQQDDELIAARPGDHVARVERLAQTRGDFTQDAVADAVTERVVDRLEPVEVDVEQGETAIVERRRFQYGVEALFEREAIRQAGQTVAMRRIEQLLLSALE